LNNPETNDLNRGGITNKALAFALLSLTSILVLLAGLWYSNVFAYTGGSPSYDYRVYVSTKRDGGFDLSLIVRNKGVATLKYTATT